MSNSTVAAIDPTGVKLGPLWLVPGVSKTNVWAFFFAAFCSVSLVSFVSAGQPYLFQEVVKVASEDQGRISSYLALVQECVAILLIAPFGALADKLGRRPIYAFGFLMLGIGYILYPLAGSVEMLFAYRFFIATGAAAVTAMLATVQADYPQERSRGLMVGFGGIFIGIGVVSITRAASMLPGMFTARGDTPMQAGIDTFQYVGFFCILVAIILQLGLKRGGMGKTEETRPFMERLKAGFAAAKNPRIRLAFASSFISRGDLVVIGLFFNLLMFQAGIADGLSSADAAKQGLFLFVMVQVAALFWSPVIGILSDKFNRLGVVMFAFGMAMLGYFVFAANADPLNPLIIPICLLLGIGEVSAILASQALIGQDAKLEDRGSIIGVFGACGAVGIIFATTLGGQIYDLVSPAAPFVMMGVLNAILFVWALIVWLGERKMKPALAG
jgi:MFS family permease